MTSNTVHTSSPSCNKPAAQLARMFHNMCPSWSHLALLKSTTAGLWKSLKASRATWPPRRFAAPTVPKNPPVQTVRYIRRPTWMAVPFPSALWCMEWEGRKQIGKLGWKFWARDFLIGSCGPCRNCGQHQASWEETWESSRRWQHLRSLRLWGALKLPPDQACFHKKINIVRYITLLLLDVFFFFGCLQKPGIHLEDLWKTTRQSHHSALHRSFDGWRHHPWCFASADDLAGRVCGPGCLGSDITIDWPTFFFIPQHDLFCEVNMEPFLMCNSWRS